MKITIFAKQRKTADGRPFTSYITRLTRISDGNTFAASVKFRESCGAPPATECPCILEINKRACNLSSHEYTNTTTGETGTGYELWVTAWKKCGEYIDTSMDDIAE